MTRGSRSDAPHLEALRAVPHPRWFAPLLLTSAALAIAVATLTPRAGGGGGGPVSCVFVCGSRGLADTVANILLFLPFGFGLGVAGFTWRRAILLGILVSCGVELGQLVLVTGRDTNIADVVSNSIGVFVGASLGRSFLLWVVPPAQSATRRLIMGGLVVLMTVGATGVLLAPSLPPEPYWGQLGLARGGYSVYAGHVLSGTIQSQALPRTGVASPGIRQRLLQGDSLRVKIEVAPIRPEPAQIVMIADAEDEVLFIGADASDLVLHYRSRSDGFWLDAPTVRLRDGFAPYAPGDPLELLVWRERTGFCLGAGAKQACPEYTAASGWVLFQNGDSYPWWVQSILDFGWIAVLAFPLGLWYRPSGSSRTVLSMMIISALTIPYLVGLVLLTLGQSLAGIAGFLAGRWAYRWGVRWVRRHGVMIEGESWTEPRQPAPADSIAAVSRSH